MSVCVLMYVRACVRARALLRGEASAACTRAWRREGRRDGQRERRAARGYLGGGRMLAPANAHPLLAARPRARTHTRTRTPARARAPQAAAARARVCAHTRTRARTHTRRKLACARTRTRAGVVRAHAPVPAGGPESVGHHGRARDRALTWCGAQGVRVAGGALSPLLLARVEGGEHVRCGVHGGRALPPTHAFLPTPSHTHPHPAHPGQHSRPPACPPPFPC